MTSAYDVPANTLLEALARYFKERVKEINPPNWARFAKTGPSRKSPPHNLDWWYMRAASILRKLYIGGPIGVSRLRSIYGGRKDYPMRKARKLKSGGANIRKILQQLEKAGLIQKTDKKTHKGRVITPKGERFINAIVKKIS
ncbi:MAG: 30S ribosomal protein S19e, partial [Thermoproteota archaeon]